MLFNSGSFLVYFLPVTFLGFRLLGRFGARTVVGWLVLASLFFYLSWRPAFLLVLLTSLTFNFGISQLIARADETGRRRWLWFGIAANLVALGYFKYLFPVLHFSHELGWIARDFENPVLPLGISFFTFTQIAYLVDLSQGMAKPEGPIQYAFFVTFFPHLVAGPILHHREIMPQVSGAQKFAFNRDDAATGLSWFVLGLAKKCIVADKLAVGVTQYFDHPVGAPASIAWLAVLSYSLQLYFDFSGYSDMAIGLARMFSVRFPLNFASPYKSTSIIDFWQRWHMTLTRYLTLYLYTPISLAIKRRRVQSGQKVNKKALATVGGFVGMVAVPTLLTMFLAGIWHGAGFQFLIFGVLHGVYLTVNHAWRTFRPAAEPASGLRGAVTRSGSLFLTYACVLVGQIFFRANSAGDACEVLASLVGQHALAPARFATLQATLQLRPALLLGAYVVVWFLPNTQEWLGQVDGAPDSLRALPSQLTWRPSLRWAVVMGGLFFAAVMSIADSSTFLYFQF